MAGFWYQYYLALNCGFLVPLLLVAKDFVSKLQLGNLLFTMSMWDLTSDDGRTTEYENAETLDEKAIRWPQAYSAMLGAHGKESDYSTRRGIDSGSCFRYNLEWTRELGNGPECY